jgi:hypothetical protein
VTNAAYLTWTKPQCLAGQDMCFVYDDGTMENGLYWANANNWFGNKFIITPTFSGSIKSFDLLWWNNAAATNQPFTIDVFSLAGVLLGTSQTFFVPIPAPTTFMTVTLTNEIPFSGQFYGMVHFNMLGVTHYLGMDQNGPYVNSGVGYWYNGTIFQNASALGYGNTVWTVRCCAFVYGEDKLVTLGPDVMGDVAAPVINPSSPIAGPVALNPSSSFDSHNYTTTPPDVPMAGTGLIGYNVYQNGAFNHYVPGPDSLSTYCYNLDPGQQCFDVKAKYDLTVYGFPGTFGLSLAENPGPACIVLNYGYPLPFNEPWNGGSLGYQNWTNDNNWLYTPAFGNPAPSSNFTWQPILANYNKMLTSPTIDASAWTCAGIYLDFDYKLDDRDANSTEFMDVDVQWDNKWHNKAEMTNAGSVDWTTTHLDISGAKGKGLKVRFRANGTNTQHILNWYIDNVHVYGVCASPITLDKTQSHDTINLTWAPPVCGPSYQVICYIFDDGTMENGLYWANANNWFGNLFPVAASTTGDLTSFDLLWWNNAAATNQPFTIDVFSAAGTLLGTSQTFFVPIPAPTTFMTITLDNPITFTGPFYGMVHFNMLGVTHYLGMDQDGPYINSNVGMWYDGTTFQNASALGYGVAVWTVRCCANVAGEDKAVKLGPMGITSSAKVTSKVQGPVAVSPVAGTSRDSYNHSTMELGGNNSNNSADSSLLIGYNVFRYDDVAGGIVNFHQLNTTGVINATAYTDVVGLDTMQYGMYKYFVTAVFNNSLTGQELCESPGSDTITIQFPAVGIPEVSGGSIMIYPNPANEFVNVKSDYNISRIEVLNFIGQTVYSVNTANTKVVKVNTSSLEAGVYFVRVTTSKGNRTAKITVVR